MVNCFLIGDNYWARISISRANPISSRFGEESEHYATVILQASATVILQASAHCQSMVVQGYLKISIKILLE